MVVLSVFVIFIIFESPKLLSHAVNTYCTVPCPFMCPAQPARNYGTFMLPPRRPIPIGRSYYDPNQDYEESPEDQPELPQPSPQTPQTLRSSQQPPNEDPLPPTPPAPKGKPKPPPKEPKTPPEDPEPAPKKKKSSTPPPSSSGPSVQPTRRFFTSLFSIPGAVVDTLISGEVTL